MDAIQKVQKDIEAVEGEMRQVKSQLANAGPDEKQRQWKEVERLGKREEQLRAKQLLLLQPAGASSSSLNLLWLLPGTGRQALHLMR